MPKKDTTDLTEAVPTLEPKTRKSMQKFAAIGLAATAGILLIDDQIKKFKNRKTVTVTVEDAPSES